jgi:hypothetical protein
MRLRMTGQEGVPSAHRQLNEISQNNLDIKVTAQVLSKNE